MKKIGLAVITVIVLAMGGCALAKYNTGSYAHILYEKIVGKTPSQRISHNHHDILKESKASPKVIKSNSEPINRVEEKLQDQKFNGAYAIIQNGNVSQSKVLGKNVKDGKLYQVAGLENILTAAAIVRLIDQGKLSLSTPISKFYSNSLETNKEVTIKSLLDMTSGISNEAIPSNQLQPGSSILQWNLNHANTSLDIGKYNNQEINYVLLEGIISQVSGMSYQAFVNNNFLKPNGLSNIRFIKTLDNSEMATPFNNGQPVTMGELAKSMNSQMGENQIMASPSDFLRLIQDLIKEYGNKPGFLAANSQNTTGQLIAVPDGYQCSGGIEGFKVAVKISKNGKSGVILMSNDSNGSADANDALLKIAKIVCKVDN